MHKSNLKTTKKLYVVRCEKDILLESLVWLTEGLAKAWYSLTKKVCCPSQCAHLSNLLVKRENKNSHESRCSCHLHEEKKREKRMRENETEKETSDLGKDANVRKCAKCKKMHADI